MSTIFGLIHFDERPFDPASLQRMATFIAAPSGATSLDGTRFWIERSVGLGCGISAFTPEDMLENQPLVSPSGRFVLIADARVDNREELARSFAIDQAQASNLADSTFILLAWEKWGADCPNHIAGLFSFAIWDTFNRSLFAARSFGGGRPFYYHSAPYRFAFASAPRGLLALPDIPRVLNEQCVADVLVRNNRAPEDTYYKDIRQLPPGHTLTLRAGCHATHRYWPPRNIADVRLPRDEDYVAAFSELLECAIAACMRSVTPVGVMMSGGLDSTGIAAVAAHGLRGRGTRLATFTETPRPGFAADLPPIYYSDETPFVKAVAAFHSNIDLNLIKAKGHLFPQDTDSCFDWTEAPLANVANQVWMEEIYRTARAQGINVLLNGGQGNVTASWSGSGLISFLMHRGEWRRAIGEAHAFAHLNGTAATWKTLLSAVIAPMVLPAPLWSAFARWRLERNDSIPGWRVYSPINPDFAVTHGYGGSWSGLDGELTAKPGPDSKERRIALFARAYLNIGTGRALQMMHGIDSRAPLADKRIVEFCLSIPEDQYRRHGETRWLMRRAMLNRLPPEVLSNNRAGLQAADWFERLTAGRAQIDAELTVLEKNDTARRILDVTRMRKLFDQWPRQGMQDMRTYHQYNVALPSGLMMGRYLSWFERRSR